MSKTSEYRYQIHAHSSNNNGGDDDENIKRGKRSHANEYKPFETEIKKCPLKNQ